MSRLRSSRGAKAPAATRGRSSRGAARRPGVLVQAPKSDIFVAMLGIALGAIVLACLLMLLILWRYDFKANAKLAALRRPHPGRAASDPATSRRPRGLSPTGIHSPSARPGLRRPGREDGVFLHSPRCLFGTVALVTAP